MKTVYKHSYTQQAASRYFQLMIRLRYRAPEKHLQDGLCIIIIIKVVTAKTSTTFKESYGNA